MIDVVTVLTATAGAMAGGVTAAISTIALIAAGLRHNNRKQTKEWLNTEMNLTKSD
ncbi:hypothetical protein [Corynebacterium propinquum]|uniref:hypothetical protein n=1 Tax=Corynebacterium propinquum TaxID=43769 RepID=UPI001642A532|nr:hypothetical protein [Corynebacterium propinquum]DAE95868.1 MAG TPA: hypothetical protein [Caudoviricetes sp.]